MFLILVLQFQVWNIENSFQKLKKTYILQCKMSVFDSGASISDLEPWNFIPNLKKHTLGLQVQVWKLEISFQNWKTYILQSIAKTYILQCKIVFFDFQEAPEKSMSF